MTRRLDLYLNTPTLGVVQAADVVLVEDNASLQQVGFRYSPEYLSLPQAFAIDPRQLPLAEGEKVFQCRGGAPAFIDDYLPDAWGRRVLSKLALYRDGRRLNANSVIDTLSMLSHSRIGAICLVERGAAPQFDSGHPVTALQAAEQAAQQIDRVDFQSIDMDEMSLLYLANAGTGVGGARPKVLLYDDAGCYVAKFNRVSHDTYNNARVELACLTMAKAAGLDVGAGRVITGINGREVLLLERFDIVGTARQHLITVNGLLKEPATQQDSGSPFRYDDICDLLRRYSGNIEQDLKQLLRLMLFNRAINNTDDHERNFSLIYRDNAWQLAPGYDLVPSLAVGAYHAAGYGYKPTPPGPSEVAGLGRIFGLPKAVVGDIAAEVLAAVKSWMSHAEVAGVTEAEARQVWQCFHL